MKRLALHRRMRYKLEGVLSRGPAVLIGWLLALSLAMVLVVSVFVVVTGVDPQGRPFPELLRASLLRTLDPGTMQDDRGAWPFVLSMLTATIGGVFILGALIGILTTGLEGKLAELRKGRSFVAEEGHTVILGWSPHTATVISELIIANENRPDACVAILAQRDKGEMEDTIREKVGDTGRTRVICRTGSPIDPADIEIVSPHSARSIIVLLPQTGNPDAQTIKTVLALVHSPARRSDSYHIVASIHDPTNLPVAELIGRGEAQFFLADDIIARATAQICLQAGLSTVYSDLFDFGGDEIYFQEEPALVGKTFAETLTAYEDSAVMGLRFRDGRLALNPPMDTVIGPGDMVIAISEDDDTMVLSGLTSHRIDSEAIRQPREDGKPPSAPSGPSRLLVLGWNRRGPALIRELDHYLAPDSVIDVVAEGIRQTADAVEICGAGSRAEGLGELKNLRVSMREGCVTDRGTLDSLDAPSYERAIILSASEGEDPHLADAGALITLLHLGEIGRETGVRIPVVAEMFDTRDRELALAVQSDDLIVGGELISSMLAQVSENRELLPVIDGLLGAEGAELYLKPADRYVRPGKAVTFYAVVQAARLRGEVALGYRLQSQVRERGGSRGIHLNPDKSEGVVLGAEDWIIVLAAD